MPAGRPRHPLAKAEATGATKANPQRYKDRKNAKWRPLDKPTIALTKKELAYWNEFIREAAWLTENDRTLLEITCKLRAKMFTKEGLSVAEMGRLINALSKLGMTPVDRSRIVLLDGQDSSDAAAEDYLN